MNLTIEQALQLAVEKHKVGKLTEAETLYRAILETQPEHPDANHNLGVLAIFFNKTEIALPLFKKAIEASPNQEKFWFSYIGELIKAKQFDKAISELQQGKKIGLSSDLINALNKQITNQGELSKPNNIQWPKFTQQHKKVLSKKVSKSSATTRQSDSLFINEPSNIEMNSLLVLHQGGQYQEVEKQAIVLVQKYPNHVISLKILEAAFRVSGRLHELLGINQKLVVLEPNNADAHYNLGVTLQQLGHLYDAETSYKKALALNTNSAEVHYNLAITLQQLGRLDDAKKSFKNAIAAKPNYAEAHSNLGNIFQELGELEDAERSYKKAIALSPAFADPHNNLGFTLQQLGRLNEAATSYQKATLIRPDFAEAYYNLGNTLQILNKLGESVASYKKAIEIKPNFAAAYCNLGVTFQALGRLSEAFEAANKSLKINPLNEAKILFLEISKELSFQAWDKSLSQIAISALIDPWSRPSDALPFSFQLLRVNKQFSYFLDQSINSITQTNFECILFNSISKNEFDFFPLLNAILTSSPTPDSTLEKFLTNIRRNLLKVTASTSLKDLEILEVPAFYCSLAQQCFINEYVYFQTAEEIDQSTQLRDLLAKNLEENQNIPSVLVIACACYFPLYSVKGASKLFDQKWPADMKDILVQQIQEPFEELSLGRSIPVLTSIENHVSMEVQNQYEENPYPRWVRLPRDTSKKYLNQCIRSKFPLSTYRSLANDRNPEVLIAGCGTGQQSIGIASTIEGAKVLAIDLSIASLSYAMRKTAELNIDSIEYAQADLLKLKALGRTFDLIESSGVLHHLDKPFDGWEVLLSVLRPNGLMKLGFYSELARRDIVRVRNLIKQNSIGSNSNEIRNYRKHLLELKSFDDYGFATSSLDFFSTSTCRDLLFHVQEHRFNLNTIDIFIKEHNLDFLGFEIDRSVAQSYKERFPADPSATNLELWQQYEEENPDTFAGMYQFYIQKNDVYQ
jgi:tetratricopeptide (TPR) repeat protein/2-polyprenyl-3-methyl-5-hydroxy-6-metoxy-1,4-benzoquinol methylase